ncbi:MAG: sensor histidine kinase [Sphingomonadales bacterium]
MADQSSAEPPPTANDPERLGQLVRDQAQTIAHYKKMYDRSSALAKIGVWECDLATEALSWTDGVYDLFELPRGSLVTRADILAMYEPESCRRVQELRARAIEEGGSFTIDAQIVTAKGNVRWMRLTADVEMEDGHPVRVFGTKQDITEEKAAEEELRALQAELIHLSRRTAMAAMAETLAHELNQPLTAMANYIAGTRRALARGDDPHEIVRNGFDAIEASAFRASAIIRSLRAMTGGRATRREAIDPNPLILEAGSMALAAAGDGASIDYALAEGMLVLADPVQIQQVVINLVTNAIDAVSGSERREIAVHSHPTGDAMRLCVEDSGPGLAAGIADTLFDSFVSSKPGGTGIGLSICRTIVESHGGRITAANRPEGGACFTVVLPLAEVDSAGQAAQQERDASGGMRRAS